MRQQDTFAPSPFPPAHGNIEDGGEQARLIKPDGTALRRDAPSTTPSAFPPPPAASSFSPETPFPFPAQADMDPQGVGTNRPQGISPDPYAEHFSAYVAPHPAAYPDGYGAEPEFSENSKGVSPLHIALIAIILLAGLALGVGRQWWIGEKLEAASVKKPAVAALSSRAAIDEPPPSSIQSSIDRAYIPPSLPNPEKETQTDKATPTEDKPAKLALAPDPIKEAQPTLDVPPAQIKSDPVPAQEEPEPPKAKAEADTAKQSVPIAEPALARSATKRKSAKQSSSQKLASAGKKERMKEIDRVRTQAFSETSKDRGSNRKSGSSEAPIGPQSGRHGAYRTNKVAQSAVTRAQYGRCERISHIIRREQCKWALCNKKWGKGACPSFRNEKPALF